MALLKTVTFKGFEANYWKILKTSEDIPSVKTSVKVGLYKDLASRQANIENTLLTKFYDLDGVDKIREDIYEELKLLPDFDGAIDA
jgi:hypothetical protein